MGDDAPWWIQLSLFVAGAIFSGFVSAVFATWANNRWATPPSLPLPPSPTPTPPSPGGGETSPTPPVINNTTINNYYSTTTTTTTTNVSNTNVTNNSTTSASSSSDDDEVWVYLVGAGIGMVVVGLLYARYQAEVLFAASVLVGVTAGVTGGTLNATIRHRAIVSGGVKAKVGAGTALFAGAIAAICFLYSPPSFPGGRSFREVISASSTPGLSFADQLGQTGLNTVFFLVYQVLGIACLLIALLFAAAFAATMTVNIRGAVQSATGGSLQPSSWLIRRLARFGRSPTGTLVGAALLMVLALLLTSGLVFTWLSNSNPSLKPDVTPSPVTTSTPSPTPAFQIPTP